MSRSPDPPDTFRLDEVTVDPANGLISGPGGEERLQPKVMNVLLAIVNGRGSILSRQQLLDAVWHDTVVGDQVINRCIYRLRRQLSSAANTDRPTAFIETIPKRGYRLRVPVHNTGRRLAAAEESGPVARTIAVLPFMNLSSDPRDEYFSDGLTEELIHTLATIGGLRVVGRTSSFAFKNVFGDLRSIGVELNTAWIIEGSVRRSNSLVRINVQLIDAATGLQRWSGSFDRQLRDIIALQLEVAHAVADTLKVELVGKHRERVLQRATRLPEAFDIYLRARHLWSSRTARNIRKAIESFERCIELDPGFALAHAGLADCRAGLPWYDEVDSAECYEKARRSAELALSIAPELAEGHAALGMIAHEFDYDWARAGRSLREAIRLQPSYADAHHRYCNLLDTLCRHEEALGQIILALDLDPLASLYAAVSGLMLDILGSDREAGRYYSRAVDLDPNHAFVEGLRCSYLLRQERLDEAAASLDRWLVLEKLGAAPGRVALRGRRNPGWIASAVEVVSGIAITTGSRAHIIPGLLMAMGAYDAAGRVIHAGFERRSPGTLLSLTAPGARTLREDAGVAGIVREIGLPPLKG